MKRVDFRFSKRAQQTMSMPFGLIFSIFLIVIFIVIAFYAVSYFLNISQSSKVGLFYEDLQNSVDDAWSSQSSEFTFEVELPDKVEKVCFANLSAKITGNSSDYQQIESYFVYDANIFLLPPSQAEGMAWKLLSHINVSEITKTKNPYCVPVSQGLTIKKDFYDRLVTIR